MGLTVMSQLLLQKLLWQLQVPKTPENHILRATNVCCCTVQ